MITLSDLERINNERRRKGKPTLNRHQADAAIRNRRETYTLGADMTPYLIGIDYSGLSSSSPSVDCSPSYSDTSSCTVDSNF